MLDYGCGHGADVRYLSSRRIKVSGWDPYYRPDAKHLRPADVVNLGYVLNVIEDPTERAATLRRAFDLAKRALVTAVRVDRAIISGQDFGDGLLTGSGTFQKLYTQEEFRHYLESILGRRPQVASLGVTYIFKDDALEQRFLASRAFTQRLEYRAELIEEFAKSAVARRYVTLANHLGRAPLAEEFSAYHKLVERFGSSDRIERLLLQHVDRDAFKGSRSSRHDDILTYLAMLRFQRIAPPPITALPATIREDIKAGWKSYSEAKADAERFLFSLGQPGKIREACAASQVGKLLPEDLYVHRSAINELPPLLRVLLFAAHQVVGQLEHDLLKVSMHGRSLSFLTYDGFDEQPHPALISSVRIYLPLGTYDIRDYRDQINRPILHRKDAFVAASYPRYPIFQALTMQEEALGLLSSSTIGYRHQWQELLNSKGLELRGHRIVRTQGRTANAG